MNKFNLIRIPVLSILLLALVIPPLTVDAQNRWSRKVKDIFYPTGPDSREQPMLMYAPRKVEGKRPLLVALHSWSSDYLQEGGQPLFGDWCIDNDWFMIHPNFRGRNRNPNALGSELAIRDIVDAVEYMKSNYEIDEDRIYLCGVSGGGHMSLLMAARHPEIWAGVSAWCGISDIQAWWEQKTAVGPERYAKEIEKACGGKPDSNPQAAEQCRLRSPLTYLTKAGKVNLDINHGFDDGRKGSVPFTHSLHAFNKVVAGTDAISEEEIKTLYDDHTIPEQLKYKGKDPLYGKKTPLFRKHTATCRVTLFKGAHEIIHEAALNWLNLQRKGKPAVWTVTDPVKLRR